MDLLRFRYIAEAVRDLVHQKDLLPVTIGVFGDWGSGKSTVMRMVKAELNRPDFLVLEFNGWLFEDYEDAKSALLGSILDEIGARTKDQAGPVRDLLARLKGFVRRIDVGKGLGLLARAGLPLALGLPQLSLLALSGELQKAIQEGLESLKQDPQKAFETLGGLIKPEDASEVRNTIRCFRNDFGQLLAEAGITQLVVLIDDLDRCLPSTIIETLEAIKLFLFVPNSAFVIGADEDLIRYAVRQVYRDLDADGREVGRDYLEKLIQIPVAIPPLSRAENHAYINLLFAQKRLAPEDFGKVLESVQAFVANDLQTLSFDLARAREIFADAPHKVTQELVGDLALSGQIAKVALPGLEGSPRRTKRFLNSLLLRSALAKARGLELKMDVLAKLMSLEYIRPVYFKQLATLQASQEGRAKELAAAEAEVRGTDAAQQDSGATGEGKAIPSGRGQPRSRVETPQTDADLARPDTESEWLVDSWMRVWLAADPPLTGEDLRPYFFIAHDRIGALETLPNPLSPKALAVFQNLISEKDLLSRRGLEAAKKLSEGDLAAVVQAFSEKIRQASGKEAQHLVRVWVKLAEARPVLIPQALALLASVPHETVALSIPVSVSYLAKQFPEHRSIIEQQLRIWAESKKNNLANSAREQLARLQKVN